MVSTGGDYYEVSNQASPTDDSPMMFIFTPEDNVTSVRLDIRDPDETGVNAKLSVVRTGQAMQMPRPVYQSASPARFNRNVTRVTNRSTTNEMLGTHVVRNSLSSEYSWSNIDQDFVYDEWHDFMIAADVESAFIAWRPDPDEEYAADVDYILEPTVSVGGFTGSKRMSVSLSGTVRAWE